MKSNFTQDDVDAGDRDGCGKRAAPEEEVPRAGLGPSHWGESFRSGIGVCIGIVICIGIGAGLVDQVFSVSKLLGRQII